jgi:predicted ArsR family transcriptional regulator
MGKRKSLRGRLEELARIRTEEGYMAEVRPDGDGSWLFLENHCPVCAAARVCSGLCREELALFRKVIGMTVEIVRTDHIIAGARRCVYRVTPGT